MDDVRLTSQARGRTRKLNLLFLECLNVFRKEHGVTDEEMDWLFKEYHLKDIERAIDDNLVNSYKDKKDT